tara:strand:- start:127 stop:918 length:792 start_codon:yes stop_codon:yes gene_type:complete
MCYEDCEEEYDYYANHDPLRAEAQTNHYRLKNGTCSQSNRLIIRYELPLDSDMEYKTDEKNHPFYKVDWQKLYYRFEFREDKHDHHNVYLVDKEGYLHFARNGRNGEAETSEDADSETPMFKVNDMQYWRTCLSSNRDEEETFYTGCITATKYFLFDREQSHRDIRIDFHLTFKDGKVIEINQQSNYICNIARHKLTEYHENWKTWEESDKYKALEKHYWKPLDNTEKKLYKAVEKVSTFFNAIINRVCGWCRFQKSRYPEHW